MDDTYRSQFRLPYPLYERLKAEADKAGRSVNAELVVRLDRSLAPEDDNGDLRTVIAILERLSQRNPHLRYRFSFSTGDEPSEGGASALDANPSASSPDALLNQRARLPRRAPAKPKG